ncbi:MAG: hypothetical protein GYA61_08380 [Spirochaetales bacterium]|nr:hypothetical protein [Spirochaetales bacterium]
MGFKQVSKDEQFLLYYPLKQGYIYTPQSIEYVPQEEDKGLALIFYDPFCPWCIYFSEKIKETLKEIAPDLPLKMFNEFENEEEVKKRGKVYSCIVNQTPIHSIIMAKKNFQKEVMNALKK